MSSYSLVQQTFVVFFPTKHENTSQYQSYYKSLTSVSPSFAEDISLCQARFDLQSICGAFLDAKTFGKLRIG
ncbi:hypothetical protein SS1G_10345 [Sclerotinia sclerotiorum 1980 UF-70]|uniref:Uncharacterized protein n=1 Tax=Sclerotinia sclerotiorum (strain ATCC 18683 / 1980 / Ss-1) TaxID=665079 RepID=A7EYD0_SCLS1|nr:hypothetical protein SS1G_10345 [Sclerotinia sclerotiorum 1980 UF-70]EDN94472.1 hypothetical protein SS1G_10345 [Sclerotinia sclerotiorum 1980 UF-70]